VKVLHVETGRHFYGGAKQVAYLLAGLQRRALDNCLVTPPGAPLASAARSCGARVYELPMRGDLDLRFLVRLYRLLRREQPHLVHLHSRRGADTLGGLAARWAGLPCVLSRRVDNPEPRWLVRSKYRIYARVITISEGIRQVLLGQGVPADKVHCVRSAIDAQPYRAPCARTRIAGLLGLDPDERWLGTVSQLIERKGHRYLLEALPRILAVEPRARLVWFGQGPLEVDLRALAQSLGVQGRVLFAGFRPDLAAILPCLELVVHPAWREGLGVSLIEAAAAGVPMVAADAGGVPEIVRDTLNGLLVPPRDPNALAQAVLTLLAEPQRARRMGRAGQALVEREFSVDTMVDGNLAVYRALLGT
jgi:glycosyltransferase involved in cell wall biosynthesis